MTRADRQHNAVKAISKLSVSDPMTEAEAKAVLVILGDNGLRQSDLNFMEERPGMFFYDDWLWKLKSFRIEFPKLYLDYSTKAV